MPKSEAHAWWADVQDVREAIERRRDAERRRSTGGRRRPQATTPHWDDPAWADDLAAPGRRFARSDAPVDDHGATAAPTGRRTVEITGRTIGAPELPRLVQIDRRRPGRRPVERIGARPDRLALWAVVLAFFLIFVAATSSSQAATAASDAAPTPAPLTASR